MMLSKLLWTILILPLAIAFSNDDPDAIFRRLRDSNYDTELDSRHFTLASDDWSCSPDPAPIRETNDPFYAWVGTLKLSGPRFEGHHDYLCDNGMENDQAWENCLPMSTRLDESCAGSDRVDLLSSSIAMPCHASVLHMLLVDVYKELERAAGEPALVFGTLLGAVRDGGLIPFTEDVDLGYQAGTDPLPIVRRRLQAKGYHIFMDSVWRVCVAPTHPVATKLYDPELVAPIEAYTGPYLDLYRMEPDPELKGYWNIEHTNRHNDSTRVDKVLPYSEVVLNGVGYDTVADPVDFLLEEYGASYLRPMRDDKE